MFTINNGRVFALAIILTFVAASADAQQTVYKWVDKDGVVHFSDTPPEEAESGEPETLTTAPPRSDVPVAQPAAKAPTVSEAGDEKQSARPEIETPPLVENARISEMSLADLDRRCEEVREEMIAPLREAEIASCKQDKRNDPAWCERFNADYGEGGRTITGAVRPRMFDDLPECVDAQQERNRRGR